MANVKPLPTAASRALGADGILAKTQNFGPGDSRLSRAATVEFGYQLQICTEDRRDQREGVMLLTDSRTDHLIREGSSMTDYAQRLRTADLRVTRPRVAVLQAVDANPHSDTETIFEAVRDALPEVCRQTVYDVLHASRYECRVGDNHHHSVCRSCGAIEDVDCVVGEAPCLSASHQNGFRLQETEVIYWGLCQDCFTPPVRLVGTVAGNGGFVTRAGSNIAMK
jgi:Fur family transcriptional regulator, stress-responsive regulator